MSLKYNPWLCLIDINFIIMEWTAAVILPSPGLEWDPQNIKLHRDSAPKCTFDASRNYFFMSIPLG